MTKGIDEMEDWEAEQRNCFIPKVGMLIGTAGTAPYVHLALHIARKHYGQEMPILVINDGKPGEEEVDSDAARKIAALCKQYNVDYQAQSRLGHIRGDYRIFESGIVWALEKKIDILAKFSRRSIPLVPWRYGLLCLAAEHQNVCVFGRYEDDKEGSLLRTDAIALRIPMFSHDRFLEALKMCSRTEEGYWMQVENFFKSWVRCQGGMAVWDLLGKNFYGANQKMTQWRGMYATHYAEIARGEGLNYTYEDFRNDEPKSFEVNKVKPCECRHMKVVEEQGTIAEGPLKGVPYANAPGKDQIMKIGG